MENKRVVKAAMVIVIASTLVRCVSGVNLTVGGATGWDLSSNIRGWAAKTTFHPGDFLVFNYTPLHDVLEVNRTEFAACKTINPIGAYTDGESVVQLNNPGVARYFICGRSDHCSRGLKLRVRVTTTRDSSGRGHHPRQRPRPHTHRHQPPKTRHGDDFKDSPSPKSGSWDSKRDGPLGYMWFIGFLVVAPVILAPVILHPFGSGSWISCHISGDSLSLLLIG
ncbi:uclacyanin 1-like [Punica granatum]|uniref:Uclacyanin 1-like n=1 Tax=Punica granatum TaxID=22663 RepID=A0A6P8ECZ8_PUNGR|nr:uclacyanin 1-like [Punica granatum]XP_031403188.1 uclacyanin 1-like [Punica granatum]